MSIAPYCANAVFSSANAIATSRKCRAGILIEDLFQAALLYGYWDICSFYKSAIDNSKKGIDE